MSFTEGADLDALGKSVDQLSRLSSRLQEVDGAVTEVMGELKREWGGPDLTRLAHRHQTQIQPTLANLAQQVRTLAASLSAEIGEQCRASSGSAADVFAGVPGTGRGSFAGGGGGGGGWSDDPRTEITTGGSADRSGIEDIVDYKHLNEGKVSPKDYQKAIIPDAKVTLVEGKISTDPAVVKLKADNFEAKALALDASASGAVTFNDSQLQAGAAASVGATLLGVSGKVGSGPLTATGKASVGAEASGSGHVAVGKDGFSANLKGEAFVGAKAEVEAGVDLGMAKAKAGIQGYAGAGAKFDAKWDFKDGKVNTKIDMGAAVGLGLWYSVDVSIDTKPIVEGAGKMADFVGKGISSWFK